MSDITAPHTLKVLFPTRELLEAFATWMSNSGEQDFMETVRDQGLGQVDLSYTGEENEEFPEGDPRRFGEFICDNTIHVAQVGK